MLFPRPTVLQGHGPLVEEAEQRHLNFAAVVTSFAKRTHRGSDGRNERPRVDVKVTARRRTPKSQDMPARRKHSDRHENDKEGEHALNLVIHA